MTKKLTSWFPGDVKPARVGVYLRRYRKIDWLYSHWDGKQWSYGAHSPSAALANTRWQSLYENLSWRGLAVKP